jgi:hypothetical protein
MTPWRRVKQHWRRWLEALLCALFVVWVLAIAAMMVLFSVDGPR